MLKGFTKVHLNPNEEKDVTIELITLHFQDADDLALAKPCFLHVDFSWVYFARSFPLPTGTILGEGYRVVG